jgi:hypothetical protein
LTVIVPVIDGCKGQANANVPGVSKRQVPVQPGGAALAGRPLHDVGCAPASVNPTQCMLDPLGYWNVTVPPLAIVASPPTHAWLVAEVSVAVTVALDVGSCSA